MHSSSKVANINLRVDRVNLIPAFIISNRIIKFIETKTSVFLPFNNSSGV